MDFSGPLGREVVVVKVIFTKYIMRGLKEFIRRAQVVNLYRDAMRTCQSMRRNGDKVSADELAAWVRSEFKMRKDENDPERIRQYLTSASIQIRDWKKILNIAGRPVSSRSDRK